MALTVSVVGLGDGTLLVTANGMSASGRSVVFTDISPGGSSATVNTGGASQQSHGFNSVPIGIAQSIDVKVYSSTGGAGTLLQSAQAGGASFVIAPSVTVSVSGSSSGCSWSSSAVDNPTYTYQYTDLYYSINGGAYTYYGRQTSASGSIPATSVFVGAGVTVTWEALNTYHRSVSPASNYTTGGGFGSATTASGGGGGGSPPAAPNPVTNLAAVDHTSNVALTWTASAGGATGYQIKRNGSVLTTTSSASYTDNSPPARPITYTVTAYNSNANGTTYAAPVSVSVGGAVGSQRAQMIV